MREAKSSVNWMEEIPEGWEIKRIRDIFTFGKGLPITKADLVEKGIPVISYGQIHAKSNTGVHLSDELLRFVPESYLSTGIASKLKYGDIVFADTSEDTEGIGNNVFIDREDTMMAGYHTLIARTKLPEYAKYLAYLFKSECWRNQLRSVANGIKVFSITQKMLKTCTVVLPTVEYSNKAVSFLDSACSDIDTAIAEAKASIEDYKLLKQSIITKAVTKGLNPTVPMKDSGIKWIGEIPEHWTISKLKYLLDSPLQYGANESGIPYETELPRYIRITDIDLDGNLKNDSMLSLNEDQASGYILDDEDILLARSGATVGKAFYYQKKYGRAAFAGYMIRAKINKNKIVPKIFYYSTMTSCYMQWKESATIQATIQNIGASRYNDYTLAIPDKNEQKAIITYLDNKCAETDSLITEKEAMIADLEAYKKSLIFEVVTGKRKVC